MTEASAALAVFSPEWLSLGVSMVAALWAYMSHRQSVILAKRNPWADALAVFLADMVRAELEHHNAFAALIVAPFENAESKEAAVATVNAKHEEVAKRIAVLESIAPAAEALSFAWTRIVPRDSYVEPVGGLSLSDKRRDELLAEYVRSRAAFFAEVRTCAQKLHD